MKQRFSSKDEALKRVRDQLQAERVARFPFQPHRQISNFAAGNKELAAYPSRVR